MADVGLGGRATEGSERSERSAGEILRARLGDEVVDRLVDPLLGGINAGSVDTMSLGTAAPQIARALVGHRDVIAPLAATAPPATGAGPPPSPFFGLRGGLSRLVDACCAELRAGWCRVASALAGRCDQEERGRRQPALARRYERRNGRLRRHRARRSRLRRRRGSRKRSPLGSQTSWAPSRTPLSPSSPWLSAPSCSRCPGVGRASSYHGQKACS